MVTAAAWIGLACAAPAQAQQTGLKSDGKALSYRLVDSDTGEELLRATAWRGTDSIHLSRWTETFFPNGDREVSQCVLGNGEDKPATMRFEVTLDAAGKIGESDFETFDPSFYPFLQRPLPLAALQPITCFSTRGIDYAALKRGDDVPLWVWLDDAIYCRVLLRTNGKELVSVPAGRFDAWKVRVKIDLTTFFPRLPSWAAKTISIFAPDIEVWVAETDHGDFEVVRQTGFAFGKHRHTAQELTAIGAIPEVSRADLDLLLAASHLPGQTRTAVVNSGSFTIGELRGRAVMSSAKDGSNELLVVHSRFTDGVVLEERSLLDATAAPITNYMEQRTYAPNGALVQRKHLVFRPESFPLQPDIELPPDLFANSLTLAEVFPRVRPRDGAESRFHIVGFGGVVSQLVMRQAGITAIDGQGAEHMKVKPEIDLPFYLKPLEFFLIPAFDAYLQDAPPYRLLEFVGPLGPPGSDSAHFVADSHLAAAAAPGGGKTRDSSRGSQARE